MFDPGSCALNRVYVGDITSIRTHEGWLYLATRLDLASRAVVGFSMADHMRASLVGDALAGAIRRRHPAAGFLFHSDRGSQGPAAGRRPFSAAGAAATAGEVSSRICRVVPW